MGVKEVPWLKLTLFTTMIYSIVTILVLFSRPDFISVSILLFI